MNGSASDLRNSDLQNEVRRLANRMADGTATSGDAARLSTLLLEQPELRDVYLDFVDTHALLCWEFRNQDESPVANRAAPVAIVTPRRMAVSTWLPWTMMFVATVVAIMALVRPGVSPRNEPAREVVSRRPAVRESITALLVDEAGAEFAAGRGPDGVRFGPGEYELLKGVVHLRFAQGADVVLASPARLEVVDSLHLRMAYGKVRVVAPPAAKGFTIATPAADFVDLGTEFGLRVAPGNGASDLYVFDGQVNVADRASGKLLSEVLEGQSSRYVDGVTGGDAPEIKASEFPTPGAIGFARWQEHQQRMRRDRRLRAYFPFQRTADENVLANAASDGTSTDGASTDGAVADGRIVGARWASGRWPGKDALLFDRDSDCVQLEIPGEYQELTIAVWMKLDRLDFGLNAILNSDGAEVGDVHFQMTRQGLPRGGIITLGKTSEKVMGRAVLLGRWVHVAMVLSVPDRSQRIYVDGEVARTRTLGEGELIRPGSCRIGNWLPAADFADSTRALRGRMDELVIWSRALSQEDLSRHVQAGRTGFLETLTE